MLLFVDQLEELYSRTDDPEIRRLFMAALYRSADDPQGPVRTVFTAREDFLGQLAEDPAAREVLSRVTVLRSPAPEALGEIIEAPVHAAGYSFDDPDLVEEMVSAIQGEPAALPLLQFTGQMLWKTRDRQERTLRRAAYDEMGGIEGALAHHADGVLQGLSPAQLRLARDMLLRLIVLERPDKAGTSQPMTCRALSRTALLDGLGAGVDEVLDRLVKGRLLLVRQARSNLETGEEPGRDEAELELVHESLIRSWDRLARWIAHSREDVAFRSEVVQATELWDRRGRRTEELWQGDALADALRWRRRSASIPSIVEQFLRAGQARQRQRRRRRRLLLAGVFTTVVLAALVLALQTREANRQRGIAEERHRTGELKRAAGLWESGRSAALRGDLLEARSKVRESLEIHDSMEARALWGDLSEDARIWKADLRDQLHAVQFSPDGTRVAVAGEDRSIHLFDVETRALLRILRGHTATLASLAFSPDGRLLASGSIDGTARLWDVDTGKEERRLLQDGIPVADLDVGPDGRLLVTSGTDGAARLWLVETGELLREFAGHTDWVTAVAIRPDGLRLATAGRDLTVRLWDIESGTELTRLGPEDQVIVALDYSPAGDLLAASGTGAVIRLWDAATGELRREVDAHRAAVPDVAFGPRGELLASAGFDHSLRIWATGRDLSPPPAPRHSGAAWTAQFSASGDRLLSTGSEIILWDVETGEPLWSRPSEAANRERFSPDGTLIAQLREQGSIHVLDAATGERIRILPAPQNPSDGPLFSPDGRTIGVAAGRRFERFDAVSGERVAVLDGFPESIERVGFIRGGAELVALLADGSFGIWSATTGRKLRSLASGDGAPFGFAIDPDGRRIAVGGYDRGVGLWDLRTGDQRTLWRREGLAPAQGSFHPDGQRYGLAASDHNAYVVDLDGTESLVLRGARDETTWLSFSPDGNRVAASSEDGSVRLWEAETGHPVWWAPAMLHDPPMVRSHRGWIQLGEALSAVSPAPSSWRATVEERARHVSQSPDGTCLCVATHDGTLELWDIADDVQRWSLPMTEVRRILAISDGCLTLTADGHVQVHDLAGDGSPVRERATAVGWDGRSILVAGAGQASVIDPEGGGSTVHPVDMDVTAVSRIGDLLLLGYRDGGLEALPMSGPGPTPQPHFQGRPASAVERILAGPDETLIAGFSNGFTGVWSLDSGALLDQTQLRGPAVHLVLDSDRLLAGSELGDLQVLELGVLGSPYCELMREVWADVPTIWAGGRAIGQAPGADHICSP